MFLVGLTDRFGKKSICQINSCILGTRGCMSLLKKWNYICYNSCSWSHHLVKLAIILTLSLRSIYLLHGPNRSVECGFLKINVPESFKSLMVAQLSSFLQYMWYYLAWFTIFLGIINFNGFCLAFPTTTFLTPQVRKPIWGFSQLPSISIPIIHSKSGEITTAYIQRHTGPTVRMNWAKRSLWYPDHLKSPIWPEGYSNILVILKEFWFTTSVQ